MGKPGVTHMNGWQRNIWWFEAFFNRIQALRGPQEPLRVPKGFQWMTWEVEIKYSTIGKLGVACFKGGKRSIWWFEAFFWLLPDTMGTPKGPPKVSNGQSRVPSKVLIRYFTMGHCLKAKATLFCPRSKFKKWKNDKIRWKKISSLKSKFSHSMISLPAWLSSQTSREGIHDNHFGRPSNPTLRSF